MQTNSLFPAPSSHGYPGRARFRQEIKYACFPNACGQGKHLGVGQIIFDYQHGVAA
jgi:hypothetical protein